MAQSWALLRILDGVFSNTRGSENSFLTVKSKHTEGLSREQCSQGREAGEGAKLGSGAGLFNIAPPTEGLSISPW